MKIATHTKLSALPAGKQYRALRRAILSRRPDRCAGTVHHNGANQNQQWEEVEQEGFEVTFKEQVFQLQLLRETQRATEQQRVIMFCRRIAPPSPTVPKNTQRGTFNSSRYSDSGFFMRPYLPAKRPEYARAFAAELPPGGGLPCWQANQIRLGDGPADALLNRFLAATAVVHEIKDQEPGALARRYPVAPTFSVEDIRAAGAFDEGRKKAVSREVRERSAKLRQLAVEHYQKRSADGRLRCFVDDWAPTIPVRGHIVEIHHDEALAGFPEQGKSLTFEEAIHFLFPLCPICHRMLHSNPNGGSYTVAELRRLVRRKKKGRS